MDELPHTTEATGGPRKVSFDEGLRYITGRARRDQRLPRFRCFLADGMNWSQGEIDLFIESRTDRWPPIEYPAFSHLAWVTCPESWPLLEPLFRHPAAQTILLAYGVGCGGGRWLDSGGFLAYEVAFLKAFYFRWWPRRVNAIPRR